MSKEKKYKYVYIVNYIFQNGSGVMEVFRDKKVDRLSEFRSLQEYIRECLPHFEKLYVSNLIELKNK